MTLVHITLNKDLMKDPVLLSETVARIVELAEMVNINQQRLDRYGIISGEVPDSNLSKLASLNPEIDSTKGI